MEKFDVCVIGNSSIDLTLYEKEDGSFDETSAQVFFGGKGANQAIACARAGVKVCIIAKVGDDKYGKEIIENFSKNNVTTFIDIEKEKETDCSKIYVNKNGDNKIDRKAGIINLFTKQFIDKYLPVIQNSDYIVTQLKMPEESVKYLIDICYKLGKPIILTPCTPLKLSVATDKSNIDYINKLTYICANENESKILFGCNYAEESVKFAPNKLIATLGERGLVFNNGSENVHIDAIKDINVVDTTGAGDTFCGNFIANLVRKMPFIEAVTKSQYASAYKIQYQSAQSGMPTLKELEEFIKEKSQKTEKYFWREKNANKCVGKFEVIEPTKQELEKELILKFEQKLDG